MTPPPPSVAHGLDGRTVDCRPSTGKGRIVAAEGYPEVRTGLPGPRSAELLERLDRVLISSLTDHDEVPFVEARKSDWLIEDVDGNTFADHVSAWGTTQLGAAPPTVIEAVNQAQAYVYAISDDRVGSGMERLYDLLKPAMDRIDAQMASGGGLSIVARVWWCWRLLSARSIWAAA